MFKVQLIITWDKFIYMQYTKCLLILGICVEMMEYTIMYIIL